MSQITTWILGKKGKVTKIYREVQASVEICQV